MKKRNVKRPTPRSPDARLIAFARRYCALDASSCAHDALWVLHGALREATRRQGAIR